MKNPPLVDRLVTEIDHTNECRKCGTFLFGRQMGGNKENNAKVKLYRLAKARLDLRTYLMEISNREIS